MSMAATLSFNSTLVRLRALATLAASRTSFCGFNSTLVRLRVRKYFVCRCYNSIVSIPHWFDWESPHSFDKLVGIGVSIPHWFDWELRCAAFDWQLQAVSIPHWFDWEAAGTSGQLLFSQMFQFHIGSIESVLYKVPRVFNTSFNSTLVRLRGRLSAGLFGSSGGFQFHIGSIESHGTSRKLMRCRKFQFHIGSIESLDRQQRDAYHDSFNSTLVRLRDDVSNNST